MSKHTTRGNFVAEIIRNGKSVKTKDCKSFRDGIYFIHDEVGKTHFGELTEYEDGSAVREFLNEDGVLVAIVRSFRDDATPAKSARKAKPARKTARKSSKAAESGKTTAPVHFTAAQKKILLEGLKRFVNGLR